MFREGAWCDEGIQEKAKTPGLRAGVTGEREYVASALHKEKQSTARHSH